MKISKMVRIITVAPIIALITCTLLFFFENNFFYDVVHYLVAITTLTVFPLLAYPISIIKPKQYRRKFQRTLAIIMAVLGYISGILFAVITKAPATEIILYLTYLISGAAIAISSFVLKKKSSGHACGIAGPVILLSYYLSPLYLLGLFLLVPVYSASLKMKRHTVSQLISGTVIPVISFLIATIII